MTTMVIGMLLFFGIHLLPGMVKLRRTLVDNLGEDPYKGFYSVIALIGFILIIYGKSVSPFRSLWHPPAWGSHVALVIMVFSFIFLAASNMKTNIRRFTRHPMLWGVTFWSIAHLLANGDQASLLLFGSFLTYSLFAMYSANKRGARKSKTRYPLSKDIATVVSGVAVYALFLYFHATLFGVPVPFK